MKNLFYILLIISLFSCTTSPFECEFSGQSTSKSVNLSAFDIVEVNPMITLTIFQDTDRKIDISTDKDVIENISYEIQGNKLILSNHTDCLIENSDAVAHITLYTPELKKIIANTELTIQSGNTWHFNDLTIVCDNINEGTNNVADFNLEVNMNKLKIRSNGSSVYKVAGTCNDLSVGFYGSGPSFWGQNLQANKIYVFQRSQADMHLYPIDQITGELFGYGDIYLYHRPTSVNINKHYSGHIYYVD